MADNHLYDILGVSRTASDNELKQNYRRLAKEFHPDRNPDGADKFKEISFAYETLSDPRLRSVYDRYGVKGVQDSGMSDGASFHNNLFTSLFGGGLGANLFGFYNRRRMRAEDTIQSIEVHLCDFYNGKAINVPFDRRVYCNECEGKGSKSDKRCSCQTCNSTGSIITEGEQAPCPDCQGAGDFLNTDDLCKMCQGRGVCKEPASVTVNLEKGMTDNEKFYFRGKGDRIPESEPGDVIILLSMIYDGDFAREHDNLLYQCTISLADALCGFTKVITHMDNRKLLVRQAPGEVIKPDAEKVIVGEGMPIKDSEEKGNLVVKFTVDFPASGFANDEQLEQLKNLLPQSEPVEIPEGEDVEEVILEEYKPDPKTKRSSDSEEEEDDDSGIQCAQQ